MDMRRSHLLATLVIVTALALTVLPPARAQLQTIPVFVDGQQVAFDQPPAVMGGRVLVPLRGVFERMGAVVHWYPANNTVVATRAAATQIQLVVGSRQAVIDGNAVALDVPPIIVGGRTLVPLRFVSEAMGARVDWDDASRTVYIVSGQAAQAPPPPPVAQPAPPPPVVQPAPAPPPPVAQPAPPPAGPIVIQGVVARTDLDASRIVVVRDGREYTLAVNRNTTIRLVDVDNGRVASGELSDVLPGMPVQVTAGPRGLAAIQVRASVREVEGRIDAVNPRAIVLVDGRTVMFGEEVRIEVDDRSAQRRDLRPGMAVSLVLNPQTNTILGVRATTVAQAPPPRPDSLIRSVEVNARPLLHPGDVVLVTMRGTARGVAAFRIERVTDWIAMRALPDRPGVYVGSYTIRQSDRAQGAQVTARLSVGDVVARSTAPNELTIIASGAVPAPVVISPAPGTGVRAGWVVRGTALPGQEVVVRVDYRTRVLVVTTGGTLGEFRTVADSSGRWAVTINRNAPASSEVTITVLAVDDSSGQRSEATVVTVRQV
jgi:hypothetical protein